jgi:hypothetical protein
MALVALVGLAAVTVAVGANLLLIDRAPAVDPLGRLSPSVVTVDVGPPPAGRTETEPGRTETGSDAHDRGDDDRRGRDHDEDDD